jgi:hypothetical protein
MTLRGRPSRLACATLVLLVATGCAPSVDEPGAGGSTDGDTSDERPDGPEGEDDVVTVVNTQQVRLDGLQIAYAGSREEDGELVATLSITSGSDRTTVQLAQGEHTEVDGRRIEVDHIEPSENGDEDAPGSGTGSVDLRIDGV